MRRAAAAAALAGLLGCGGLAQHPEKPPPAPTAEWAMEGGGPARTSRSSWAVPRDWSVRQVAQLVESGYGPEEHAAPIAAGPVVFAGHSGKKVEALHWAGGSVDWSAPMKGRVYATPARADGLLFVGDDAGYLTALRPDGREAWVFRASYPIVTAPLAAAGKVYVGVSDQNVFCLEAATGRPIWQYGRKFPRRNSQWRTPNMAWGENRLYAGFADGTVVALDGEVGRVLWKAETGREGLFSDILAGPAFLDGKVYAGALRGPVVCLDAATGKELWRQELEVVAGIAAADGALYVGSAAGKVVALSAVDGVTRWEAALDGGVPTAPVVAGDTVVVGASEGSVFALDAGTGAVRQRYAPGSGVRAQPLVFEGGVLFVTNAGALFRIEGGR